MAVQEKSKFRGVAARINYLTQDRADLQFAAKDLCRHMARGPQLGQGEKNRKVFEREAESNPALRIWEDCAAAGWFHRLGLGWRASEYEVHIWRYLDVEWLLDQVVVDNNRAQLRGGGIVRNEQVRPARIISGERRL